MDKKILRGGGAGFIGLYPGDELFGCGLGNTVFDSHLCSPVKESGR